MTNPIRAYFASDFHLGCAGDSGKRDRELKVVRWLDSISSDATHLFLLGDVFDFWFEYRDVVPKGFVRLQGKLAQMADAGIEIHVFSGNHDVWMFDYLPTELGVKVHHGPIQVELDGWKFFIGHGDGLGPGDHGYKLIKMIFRNPLAQRIFAMLHPWIGYRLARFFSRKSREATGHLDDKYLGDNKEFLVQFCLAESARNPIDYFIFGHRHLFIDMPIGDSSRYINLGDWFTGCHYARFADSILVTSKFEV